MNITTRIISIISIVVCCVSIACSQVSPSNKSKNPPSPPPESSKGPLKTVGRAQANYSSQTDQTEGIVLIDLNSPSQAPQGGLSMMAHFSVQGRTITQPENIYLGFNSASPKLKYKDDHRLTIYCDGTECFSGDTRMMHTEESARGANETMQSPAIRYNDYLRILDSHKIIIQLGHTKVELTGEDLEGLRDLKRLVGQ